MGSAVSSGAHKIHRTTKGDVPCRPRSPDHGRSGDMFRTAWRQWRRGERHCADAPLFRLDLSPVDG